MNKFERIFVALMLLLGCLIFSYIMGEFNSILANFKVLNASFDDGDNLSKFIGCLKKFNNDKDINF